MAKMVLLQRIPTSVCICILCVITTLYGNAYAKTDISDKYIIDSLIDLNRNVKIQLNYNNSINAGIQLVNTGESLGNEKGIVFGYLFLAEVSIETGSTTIGQDYIKKIESHAKYLKSDPEALGFLNLLKCNLAYYTGVQTMINKYFYDSEKAFLQVSSTYEKQIGLIELYRISHYLLDSIETNLDYILKIGDFLRDSTIYRRNKVIFNHYNTLYNNLLAYYFFYDKFEIDSAKHYFQRGLQFIPKEETSFFKFYYHEGMALCFEVEKNYSMALFHAKEAKEVVQKFYSPIELQEILFLISKLYAVIGDTIAASPYLMQSKKLKDSLEIEEKAGREYYVLQILKDKDIAEKEKKRKQSIVMFLAILLLGAVISIYIYKRVKIKQKITEEKVKQVLLKQEVLIKEKENIESTLQQKTNELFDDLINLAKNNDPSFYVRFREIYPKIHAALIEINPELKLSELTLCGYIYLDIPAKEMADYTFKSVRTIQSRKSDLRKRLGINSNVDLHTWIKGLE